jgi:hypothetical protein
MMPSIDERLGAGRHEDSQRLADGAMVQAALDPGVSATSFPLFMDSQNRGSTSDRGAPLASLSAAPRLIPN